MSRGSELYFPGTPAGQGTSNAAAVGEMKMRNIVSRVGIEPTPLAFWASMLPLHYIGFPDVTTMPTPTFLCSSLLQRSV